MFEATAAFTLLDYFRVPYDVQHESKCALAPGVETLRIRGGDAFVAWPTKDLLFAKRRREAPYLLDALPLFGRVASPAETDAWRRTAGGKWHDAHEVRHADGSRAAVISQRDDGSIVLPFDPNALIESYWSERYLEYVRPAALNRLSALARRSYYRARPLLPRSVQMGMRRSFSRLQSKTQFPRWPIETALHDLYDFLFSLLVAFAERPIPYLGLWPRNWSWAFVLTHDVEAQIGYDRLSSLLDVEVEAGYRSSWNFVPQGQYTVDNELLRSLRNRGFEVGVHGLHHDGRDLEPSSARRRAPLMRQYGEAWGARGFRSPGTLRSVNLIRQLGFEYDSSFSDTAPFEPQAGGCCTWLPYMLGDVVELPITLVQDHTLFEILGHADAQAWLEKARFLRHRGGMALLLTHPDYADQRLVDSYRRILEEFAGDSTAWKALPADVADWWVRRSGSALQEEAGEWCVVGPAEGDARIEFMSPQMPSV
jgi:hypothetical protein